MSLAMAMMLNNISAISLWSVFLVDETRIPRENYRAVVSHWQTLSHNVVLSTPCLSEIQTHKVSGDRHWLHRWHDCLSNQLHYKQPLTTWWPRFKIMKFTKFMIHLKRKVESLQNNFAHPWETELTCIYLPAKIMPTRTG